MSLIAVLFDLDGTLVDSERESAEAMARVLKRDAGFNVEQRHRDFVVGHSWIEIYGLLAADFGERLTWSRDELMARTAAERVHVIREQGLRVMPGASEAVRRVRRRFPTALVTGSSREEAEQALDVLGLTRDFPVIVAAEDYTEGKPAPEAYLAAAARLEAPPARCLVVEDSRAGIAAGRAAGMRVVAVRAFNFLAQDQSAADRSIDTLEELTDDLLDEIGAAA